MDSKQASQRAGRVLVIDDDEIVLEVIRDLLATAGYQVLCLVSPIGATQVIMTQNIEAVVVDLNMPVMQGDRFITLIRSWDKIRETPIVLISGSRAAELHDMAKQLGVATVSKDSMHRTLPETLGRLLARSRARGAPPASPTAPGVRRK